jgi:hypothetical protein
LTTSERRIGSALLPFRFPMRYDRRKFLQTVFVATQATIAVQFLPESLQASCDLSEIGLLPNVVRSPEPYIYLSPQAYLDDMTSPVLDCPSIDHTRWKSWQDVGAGMSDMPSCSMHQHWLPQPESAFKPATVALAHHGASLIVYAELFDVDIFGTAKQNGVHNFADLDGDVFEMFLHAENEESYLEHHITPDNCILQLHYPRTTIMEEIKGGKNPDWQTAYASNILVPSRVLIQPKLSLWRILAIVHLDALESHPRDKAEHSWRFSFSRYDHTHGTDAPVLSSTSAHVACNFHEHSSWGTLRLV